MMMTPAFRRLLAVVAVFSLMPWTRTARAEAPSRVRAYFLREHAAASPALLLDVADTLERRTRGLMYRKTLAKKRGMLFLFDEQTPRSFWMKDTFVPLDMVFADASCRIVHVIENAEPHTTVSQSCPFASQFVVEVAGGTARKLGAQVGGLLAFVARTPNATITCPPPPPASP